MREWDQICGPALSGKERQDGRLDRSSQSVLQASERERVSPPRDSAVSRYYFCDPARSGKKGGGDVYRCWAVLCAQGIRERLVQCCNTQKQARDIVRRYNAARSDRLYYCCAASVRRVNGRRKYDLRGSYVLRGEDRRES